MRYVTPLLTFVDLSEFSYLRPPHVLITASDIAADEIDTVADLYRQGTEREVLYDDGAGNTYHQVYRLYIHPTGAGSMSLGTMVDNVDGTRTWTPNKEGRLIRWDGALASATDPAEEIAGALGGDYYTHFTENFTEFENFRCETIEEGDALWVQCGGQVDLESTGILAIGDLIMATGAATGQVVVSTAINTGGTIADYEASLLPNTFGPGARGLCVGQAQEVVNPSGLGLCDLRLPKRYIVL